MSTLLQINNLKMVYGTQPVLDDANLSVSNKQKIAVVGRNGAGKSTLFRLIIGEEQATDGEIIVHKETKIGYLAQHSPFKEGETVIDYLTRSSNEESWTCAKVAAQFQIKGDLLEKEVFSLAGGFQMRVKLVSMLVKNPNLLLLDEPTNYLDLSTQILLERFLREYKGAFLLISHDREFINRTCEQTLEIENCKTTLFPRTLEEYLAYKEQKMITIEATNKRILEEKKRLQSFVDRFGVKATLAAQAKSKMKQIERLKTIEISETLSTSNIKIPQITEKKGVALYVEDLVIGYPEKTVAKGINFDIARGEHIAVVGDNGQGKTTFLKTIAGELPLISGNFRWGSNIRIGYYAQHTPATLNLNETVEDHLFKNASSDLTYQDIYQMAGNFLFKGDSLKKPISVLSGGEKARLCLARMLLQKHEVILLDEPTNHLDFETVEALSKALSTANCTIIFVSHNRTFVETLATGIIEVNNGRVSRYHHNYDDYVYHLQKSIDEDLSQINQKGRTSSFSATSAAANPSEDLKAILKQAKSDLRKVENEMKKLDEEKQKLYEWFEKNTNTYSDEKSMRLGEVLKLLQEKEDIWLEVQQKIETLETSIQTKDRG